MINVVGLCLVAISLVTAGVWSPEAPKTLHEGPTEDRDTIVKEGHRVVVVEYDQDDQPITKVSISPETNLFSTRNSDSDKPELNEAADVLPNLGQGLSAPREDDAEPREEDHHRRGPKELICDAYGKCKHKIAGAIAKTKETVSEAAKTKGAKQSVQETVSEAVDMTKDTTHRVGEAVSGAAHEAAEKTKGAKHRIEDTVYEAVGMTKETMLGAAHEAAEKTKGAKQSIGETVSEAVDSTKETTQRVGEAVSGAAHEAAEKTKHAKQRAGEAMERAKDTISGTKHEEPKGAKQRMEETVSGAKEAVEEAYDRAKKRIEHAVGKEDEEEAVGTMEYLAERATVPVRGVRDLGKTIGTHVTKNVSGWIKEAEAEVKSTVHLTAQTLNPVSGTVYMLSFCTAYGTAVWVTFVLSHVLSRALPQQQFGMVQSKIYPAYFRTMAATLVAALLGFMLSHESKLLQSLPDKLQAANLFTSLSLVLVNMLYLEPRATKAMFEKMKAEKEEGRGRGGEGEESTTSEAPPVTHTSEVRRSHVAEAPEVGRVSEVTAAAARVSEPPPAAPRGPEQTSAQNVAKSLSQRLKRLNTWSSLLNILTLMALSWHVYYLGDRLHLSY